MGKVFRLPCQLNLWLSCFGLSALYCTWQHRTRPASPASLHRRTQSMSLYGHHSWFNSQRKTHLHPHNFKLYLKQQIRPSFVSLQFIAEHLSQVFILLINNQQNLKIAFNFKIPFNHTVLVTII